MSTPDPVIAEIIASCGFHHVIADLQHGSLELGTLSPVLTAIAGAGSTAIVRVPWNDPVVIGKALDLGALGVIVPMVETAGEAAAGHGRLSLPAVRHSLDRAAPDRT